MSKIIKPFGRPVVEIKMEIDHNGTLKFKAWQNTATAGGIVEVPLHPQQSCVLLADTLAAMLKANAQPVPQNGSGDGTKN